MNNSVLLLIARIFLAAIFILAGASKFGDISQTVGMIANAGFPAASALAWMAALFELVAGLLILVGFKTKPTAYVLALFCLFTGFVFHMGAISIPGFPEQANAMLSMFNQIMMMKNIAIAGGFLALANAGAGTYSLDEKLKP